MQGDTTRWEAFPPPPIIPESLDALERAVRHLGAITQGHRLKPKRQAELEALIGRMPRDVEHAWAWKNQLKAVLRELREMGENRLLDE